MRQQIGNQREHQPAMNAQPRHHLTKVMPAKAMFDGFEEALNGERVVVLTSQGSPQNRNRWRRQTAVFVCPRCA